MMKKAILTSSFILIFGISFSQVKSIKSDTNKVYHNELGVDVTGFFRRFFPLVQTDYFGQYYYIESPTYYLTYRRLFKYGNIRAGIGGDFSRRDVKNYFNTSDTKTYISLTHSLSTRLGWEFTNELSKRWQVYYGLDFKYAKQYYNNNGYSFNSDYIMGYESSAQKYGISPLLGFRFKLTNRLSLTTEACLSVNFENSQSKRTYTPTSPFYPSKPEETTPRINSISSSFTQPLSVILTFDI
jgi:hypothetical protein